ncbi:hypothetical protein EDD85DRAFT_939883, partial [Armillaria nabsnona]
QRAPIFSLLLVQRSRNGRALGIHVVAAGNDNTNASGISPARVAAAITIGTTSVTDGRVSFPITDPS